MSTLPTLCITGKLELNPLFHTIADLVNRAVARQATDWSVPNFQFPPNSDVMDSDQESNFVRVELDMMIKKEEYDAMVDKYATNY